MGVKIVAIWSHSFYAVRHGSACAREVGRSLVNWRRLKYVDRKELGLLSEKYGTLFRFEGWEWRGLPLKIFKPLFWTPSIAFGWFVLIGWCALIVGENHFNRLVLSVSIILSLVLIWSYAAQMFLMRIHLGAVEVFFRILCITRSTVDPDDWLAPRLEVVRRYITVVLGLIVIAVVGYSAAYYGISRLDGLSFKDTAFSECNQHPISMVTALYFSLATFSTVGFGDVVATKDIARLAVATEIVLSLGVIVLLLMVFSVTLDMED